jgi:hypothetical protein
VNEGAGALELIGAGCFGAVVGWLLYHLNRHRTDEVRLEDLVTILGAIGGGAILALFPAESELFGAYGIGLFVGFFAYFGTLVRLVRRSDKFGGEWFLDGRRGDLEAGQIRDDDQKPMRRAGKVVG